MKVTWGEPVSRSVGGWNRAVRLEFETEAEHNQALVLVNALTIYTERNSKYRDNWKRMGWRGMLIRIRERSERLWDSLWDAPDRNEGHDVDDAIDLINFAAFLVRGAGDHETDRDGEWWGSTS